MESRTARLGGRERPVCFFLEEHMGEQDLHLVRVRDRIGKVILLFCRARIDLGAPEFRMQDLVEFVREAIPFVAPDSASRILRDLRQRGEVACTLISRRGSLYRIERAA
jgi:hypothetical protein